MIAGIAAAMPNLVDVANWAGFAAASTRLRLVDGFAFMVRFASVAHRAGFFAWISRDLKATRSWRCTTPQRWLGPSQVARYIRVCAMMDHLREQGFFD